jgi:hypothetical protein
MLTFPAPTVALIDTFQSQNVSRRLRCALEFTEDEISAIIANNPERLLTLH